MRRSYTLLQYFFQTQMQKTIQERPDGKQGYRQTKLEESVSTMLKEITDKNVRIQFIINAKEVKANPNQTMAPSLNILLENIENQSLSPENTKKMNLYEDFLVLLNLTTSSPHNYYIMQAQNSIQELQLYKSLLRAKNYSESQIRQEFRVNLQLIPQNSAANTKGS